MLFVLPSLTKLGGGIELHGRTLVERIATLRPNAPITVVTRHEAILAHPERIAPALRRRIALCGHRDRARFAIEVVRAAIRARPTIILCGHLHHAPIALIAARLVGAKLVVWAHGVEAWSLRGTITRAALRACDRVVSVSRYTRDALARQGIDGIVIANAIDFSSRDAAVVDDLPPRPRILSVARLAADERYKGIDEVLAALPRLRSRASYLVVGDGDDRARLEAEADQRTRFFGRVDDATLQALYRAADVFVLPSGGEGFGYVFVEALAAGLPVIAGDAGGARETLADGALGTLVQVGDGDGLVAAIDAALERPTAIDRRVVEARYGLARLDAELDALLRELSPRG